VWHNLIDDPSSRQSRLDYAGRPIGEADELGDVLVGEVRSSQVTVEAFRQSTEANQTESGQYCSGKVFVDDVFFSKLPLELLVCCRRCHSTYFRRLVCERASVSNQSPSSSTQATNERRRRQVLQWARN